MRSRARLRRGRSVLIGMLALLASLGGAAWYLNGQVHFVFESHGHGNSAIWNDDEAFIFLGRETSLTAVRRYQIVIQAILGPFWYHVPPQKVNKDLMVFHIKEDAMQSYYIADFLGAGGGAFPFDGRLYFSRGGEPDDWPYVWVWSGANFLRVSKGEALQIKRQFPPLGELPHSVTEQIKREGWQNLSSLSFDSAMGTRYPIRVGGRYFELITTAEPSGLRTVLLEGRLGAGKRETLSSSPGRYRKVTKEEFLRMRNRSTFGAEPSEPCNAEKPPGEER